MTWIDLSASFGYGSKITAVELQNLRDNISAAANGDSGSPLIQAAALNNVLTTAKFTSGALNSGVFSSGSIENINLGGPFGFNKMWGGSAVGTGVQGATYNSAIESESTNYISYYIYTVNSASILNYTFDLKIGDSAGTAYASIYVSNTSGFESAVTTTQTTTSTSFVQKSGSVDVSSFGTGYLEIMLKFRTSNSSYLATTKNLCVYLS